MAWRGGKRQGIGRLLLAVAAQAIRNATEQGLRITQCSLAVYEPMWLGPLTLAVASSTRASVTIVRIRERHHAKQ